MTTIVVELHTPTLIPTDIIDICLDPNLIDFPDQRNLLCWVTSAKVNESLGMELSLLISSSLFLKTPRKKERKSYLIGSVNCYFRAHLLRINGNFLSHPRTRDFVTVTTFL